MPIPLLFHCIVHIEIGKVFLFGGLTTNMNGNQPANETELFHSWVAWIWHDNVKASYIQRLPLGMGARTRAARQARAFTDARTRVLKQSSIRASRT